MVSAICRQPGAVCLLLPRDKSILSGTSRGAPFHFCKNAFSKPDAHYSHSGKRSKISCRKAADGSFGDARRRPETKKKPIAWWEEELGFSNEDRSYSRAENLRKGRAASRGKTRIKDRGNIRSNKARARAESDGLWSSHIPVEFSSWDEYEAALDLLILQTGDKVARSFSGKAYDRFQEATKAVIGESSLSHEELDEADATVENALFSQGSLPASVKIGMTPLEASISLPASVQAALSEALLDSGPELGISTQIMELAVTPVVLRRLNEAVRVAVSTGAFGSQASAKAQWLQFIVIHLRLELEHLLGSETHPIPGRVLISGEGDADDGAF
ncbi:hypothetical protein CYMTET_55774 [Cymbomonas tetramitiformis]|uniref:Uncharacterized protein n=1 Tax=Cymbomonas tetramitiformis TaxID=36881 RepID=A0AAE0BDP8_9CHLO|nr:hypothetical protein CYMTET_55774 [Cymbomonas tetramitiformis]